jgi:hypothetical protein
MPVAWIAAEHGNQRVRWNLGGPMGIRCRGGVSPWENPMSKTTRVFFFVGMVLLTIVSMWTTYVSVNDSILPEPKIGIPLGDGETWDCSVIALALSVAIGLMLFALKLAIIDEHKRLSVVGVIGLTVLAFISISFNMDVLYRTAEQDFFMRFSAARMKSTYADYLLEVQSTLLKEEQALKLRVAEQEAELEAEIRGLREDPEGYGPIARAEDYELIKRQKETGVKLAAIENAMKSKEEADQLLQGASPQTLDEIQQLQDQLRVIVKDVGVATGVPLPPLVQLQKPLFAVFSKLFDFKTVGLKEIFFLILAFFLDLGDIVGYTLVPKGRRTSPRKEPEYAARIPDFGRAEVIPERRAEVVGANDRDRLLIERPDLDIEREKELFFSGESIEDGANSSPEEGEGAAYRRLRMRRKR